jgi:hypothetical protein
MRLLYISLFLLRRCEGMLKIARRSALVADLRPSQLLKKTAKNVRRIIRKSAKDLRSSEFHPLYCLTVPSQSLRGSFALYIDWRMALIEGLRILRTSFHAHAGGPRLALLLLGKKPAAGGAVATSDGGRQPPGAKHRLVEEARSIRGNLRFPPDPLRAGFSPKADSRREGDSQ